MKNYLNKIHFISEWKGSLITMIFVGLPLLIEPLNSILNFIKNIERVWLYYGIISPFSLVNKIAGKILSKETGE